MMQERSKQDWSESGVQPFVPLLPLQTRHALILNHGDAGLSACLTSFPVGGEATDSPQLDWQPFSFELSEQDPRTEDQTALILLPSVLHGRNAQRKSMQNAWSMLRLGEALAVGSSNEPAFRSYQLFQRMRRISRGARAYACLGRSPSSPNLKLISCRYDMQRHHFQQSLYTREGWREFATKIASDTGLYAWLESEHILVADKC